MKRKTKELFKGWGILWKYLSGYHKELIALSVFGIISALANGTVPYLAGKFFDAILKPTATFGFMNVSFPLWVALLSAWGIFQFSAIIVDWIGELKHEAFGNLVADDYRVNAFSQLLFFPIGFHKDSKIGEIMNRIDRASDSLYAISRHVVIGLAPKFLSIIIGLGFAFYMNVPLAVVLLLGVLLYVYIIARLTPKAIPLDREKRKRYSEAYGIAYEAVENSPIVKQFIAETFEKTKIKNSFKRALVLQVDLAHVWSNLSFSSRALVFATHLIIFIASVFLIQEGSMTLGELLAFNAYAAMVFVPFIMLGQSWQTLQNGLISLERTEAILSLPLENYEPKGSVVPEVTHGAIEFKNVSFAYKKGNTVLRDVSFTALPGQMVALVGESGAGKSTLIDLISGYYFPAKGKVLVDGVQTDKWQLKSLREMIGIVPQEVSLFNDTLEKNLAYGPGNHSKKEIIEAIKESHSDAFIDSFPKKYQQVVGERGVKLSVGQKQRIAIARAILRNPKILILDEPTSALDSETEKYVTEALDRVMQGRTTFIIAHRLSTVRKADKILVLEGGKIIESGTHDELMKVVGGNYRRRYELLIGVK